MIVYDLICDKKHGFQGWFSDSLSCEEQLTDKKVSCPECGSLKVQKALMSPNLNKKSNTGSQQTINTKFQYAREARKKLTEIRDNIEKTCEYLGEDFPDEARSIHYKEKEEKGIYGEATPKDVEELREEGIEVTNIPWLDKSEN